MLSFDQILLVSILVITFVLFYQGKIRYDLVSLGSLMISGVLGLVPHDEIFSGFGHPATILVVFIFVISKGLIRSGAIEILASRFISPFSHRPFLQKALMMFLVICLSGFINNIGAIAIMMPVAIHTLKKNNENPSSLLMPLSFASMLGGMMTLIGTPPNIIISTYRGKFLGDSFSMFDFFYVGGFVAVIGGIFLIFFSKFFLKSKKASWEKDFYEIETYMFEVKPLENSSIIGKTVGELDKLLLDYDINLSGLINKKRYITSPHYLSEISKENFLIIEGSQEDISRFNFDHKLQILSANEDYLESLFASNNLSLIEAVVAPNSIVSGSIVEDIRINTKFGVHILAISKDGKSIKGRLKHLKVESGDVLLLYGDEKLIDESLVSLNLLPLARRGVDMCKRKFAPLSIAIFTVSILIAAFGFIPLGISLGIAIISMVLKGIIPTKKLYDDIDWSIIVMLGSMIPLGHALEHTGLTTIIANILATGLGTSNPIIILTVLLLITMTLSDILNNAATTILTAPIAVKIAQTLGVNVDPFLMAVSIGASCAFLTPIGHQNNALVMGPGGYKFGDFWKLGLPLQIIVILVSVPFLLIMWPL